MSNRSEAEQHLRVIRSLMERATIYRAVSAEAAAVGGALAIAASFALGNWMVAFSADALPQTEPGSARFFLTWLGILGVTALANLIFLRRSALLRGEPFISSGMRLALVSLLPSFVVAGGLTALLWWSIEGIVLVVPVWITCYGLGLLATKHFAPRSLIWLGWAFLLAGLAAFAFVACSLKQATPLSPWLTIYRAQMLMAVTFGGFHLIYAVCTWPRKSSHASDLA